MIRNNVLRLITVLILLLNTTISFGVNHYWVGTGANLSWNNTVNWSVNADGTGSGASIPSSSDLVIFNSFKVGSCNIDLATVSIAGIQMNAGYTGTVTQTATNTSLTVGASNAVFSAGTFIGNSITSANIIINGTFTLSGADFSSTAGNLTFNSTVTNSSGTFIGSTVTFNSTGPQNIPAWEYLNLISSSTGARTLESTGLIYIDGAFTPGSSNSYTVTGSTVVYSGMNTSQTVAVFNYYNLTLSTSAIMGTVNCTLASGTIGIAGVFTNSAYLNGGVFITSGNTIDYNGSGAQTITAFPYYNLTSSSTGTRTLASTGTIGIANTFTKGSNSYPTITGSTINYNGTGAQAIIAFTYNNLTISGSHAGSITLANSGTIAVAGTFTNTATFTSGAYIATGSTIDFNGAAQNIPAFTFNNLTCSGTGDKTATANITVNGILNISSGRILNMSTFQLSGSTITTSGAGTLQTANITVPAIPSGRTWFFTVEYNGTTAQTIPVGTYTNLTISGIRTSTSVTMASGTISISGTLTTTATFTSGVYIVTGNTIDFNGAAQNIPAFTFNNLTCSGTGDKTAMANLTVNGVLNISSGRILNMSTFQLLGATLTTSSTGTLQTANTSATPVPSGISWSFTVVYNGASTQSAIAGTYTNCTFNVSANATGNIIVNGILDIANTKTLNMLTYVLSGTLTTNNTGSLQTANTSSTPVPSGLTWSYSTVGYNGTLAQTIVPGLYKTLTISGAHTTNNVTLASGTIGVSLTFSNTATFTTGTFVTTGNTIDFNGLVAQAIPVFKYNNLTISGINRAGSVTLANAGVIYIFGTFTNTTTFASGGFINANSTIEYNGTGTQTVIPFSYYNLTVSGARAANNVTFSSSSNITIAKIFSPFATFSTGNYIATGSTIDFNGTLPQVISAFPYYNLTSSSTGDRAFASAGTVKIANTFNKGTNAFTNIGAGGRSFTPLYSGLTTHLGSCYAVDANTAYIAGDGGVILKTTDGGTTWVQQTTNTAINLRFISFYDANNGIAVGYSGLVLKTSNGGTTWTSATPTAQAMSYVYYLNSSTVFLSLANGTILKSTDGGTTWGSPISVTAQGLYGMYFTDANTGYVVGNAGVIYKTINGGTSWTAQTSGATSFLLSSVYFTDSNTGYVTGAESTTYTSVVLKTTNGGTTWTTCYTSSKYVSSINFVDANNAYLAGGDVNNNQGYIVRTTDAGVTWTTINIGTARLGTMKLVNSSVGFIGGLDGTIVKFSCCTDGGTVEFNGTSNQTSIGSGLVPFNKLIINKTSGKLTMSIPSQVSKSLSLTQGIIETTLTNILNLEDNATSTVGTDLSFVSGPMKKIGNDAFSFPLGDITLATGGYHPLSITTPSGITTEFTAQYFAKNVLIDFPSYTNLEADTVESISNCEYWTLTRNVGTSVVKPTVGWNTNSCNVNPSANLRTAYWDVSSSQWKIMGYGAVTVSGSKGTVTSGFGINATPLQIVIARPKIYMERYAVLRRELDAGYYTAIDGKLNFKYDEDYNDIDGKLQFNIYSDLHSIIASSSMMSTSLIPNVKVGDNRYTINILDCNLSPNGRLATGKYYILEVINEKNEKRFLRFYNYSNLSLSPCMGL